MKKMSLLLAASALIPSIAFAAPNVGGCGLGSKLMEGNEGIAPQVMAVTTNGTSGNQTFGISSGTSGCTQDGVVKSNWRTAKLIDSNMNKFARETSKGQGETLDALATLLEIPASERTSFNTLLQSEFDRLFPVSNVTSQEVVVSLREVVRGSDQFSQYAEAI